MTGRTILPKLFTLVLEHIFTKLSWDNKLIKIDGTYLNQLRFADGIALLSENISNIELMLQ